MVSSYRRSIFFLLVALLLVIPYSTFLLAATQNFFVNQGHPLSSFAIKALVGWKEILLLVGVCIAAYGAFRERRLPVTLVKADLYVLLFMLGGVVVGGLMAPSTSSIVFGFRYDFSVFMFYVLARCCQVDREQLLRIGKWLLVAFLPIALFGLIQTLEIVPKDFLARFGYSDTYGAATGNPLPPYHAVGSSSIIRAMGTFPGPNSLAMYAVEMLLIGIFWSSFYWSRSTKWSVATLIAGVSCATFSRGHVVALAAGLAVYGCMLMLYRRIRQGGSRIWVSGLLVSLLIVIIAHGITLYAGSASGLGGAVGEIVTHGQSSVGHQNLAQEALQRFLDHPNGTGLGTAGLATTNTQINVFNPESWYLTLLLEFGWWGLLLAWVAIGALFKQMWTVYGDMADVQDLHIMTFFIVEFIAILVGASFLPCWFEAGSLAFWILFGFFLADYLRTFPRSSEVLMIQPRA